MRDETAEDAQEDQSLSVCVKNQSSSLDKPSIAMRRSVVGVVTYCRELTSAIDAHDFEAVEEIAHRATCVWLEGRRACRRLIMQSERISPLTQTAIAAVDEMYERIAEQFEMAITVLRVPRMNRVLTGLRATMEVAKSEPLVGPRPPMYPPSGVGRKP